MIVQWHMDKIFFLKIYFPQTILAYLLFLQIKDSLDKSKRFISANVLSVNSESNFVQIARLPIERRSVLRGVK